MNDKNDKNFMLNSGGRMKPASVVLLCIGLLIFDQISKHFIFKHSWASAITNGFGITLFRNYKFAFSLPVPAAVAYGMYAVILIGAVLYVWKKYKSFTRPEAVAWTLIFAGALSNVGERIVLGYVRDFIYILSGIFNMADGYIVVGIILLLTTSSQNKLSFDKIK